MTGLNANIASCGDCHRWAQRGDVVGLCFLIVVVGARLLVMQKQLAIRTLATIGMANVVRA